MVCSGKRMARRSSRFASSRTLPGQRIARQAVHRVLVEANVASRDLSLALHQMLDQHRQILEPLAQRRHLQRETRSAGNKDPRGSARR